MRRTAARLVPLYLASGMLAVLAPAGCSSPDKVQEVGWADVECFPYGADFYDGTYTFDGSALALDVKTGNSRCCVMINTAWPYSVTTLTGTTMVLSLEGEPDETWTRQTGTPGDVVGLWTRNGQTLECRRDGTFTGRDDPRCLEPVECGTVPFARPGSVRRGLAAHLPLILPALWILLLRRNRSRARPPRGPTAQQRSKIVAGAMAPPVHRVTSA